MLRALLLILLTVFMGAWTSELLYVREGEVGKVEVNGKYYLARLNQILKKNRCQVTWIERGGALSEDFNTEWIDCRRIVLANPDQKPLKVSLSPGDSGKTKGLEKMQDVSIVRVDKGQCLVEWAQDKTHSWVECRLIEKAPSDSPALSIRSTDSYLPNVGERVKAERKGLWYPAKVLKTDTDKILVRFGSLGKKFDEWLGPERYRK